MASSRVALPRPCRGVLARKSSCALTHSGRTTQPAALAEDAPSASAAATINALPKLVMLHPPAPGTRRDDALAKNWRPGTSATNQHPMGIGADRRRPFARGCRMLSKTGLICAAAFVGLA